MYAAAISWLPFEFFLFFLSFTSGKRDSSSDMFLSQELGSFNCIFYSQILFFLVNFTLVKICFLFHKIIKSSFLVLAKKNLIIFHFHKIKMCYFFIRY